MRPAKYAVQFFGIVFFVLAAVLFAASAETEIDLPVNNVPAVTAAAGEEPLYLAPYIRYAFNLDAKDAKSALAQKDSFKPYDVLALKKDLGTYWFLISFDKIKDKDVPTAYLDLGNFLPKNSHVLVFSNSTGRWQVLEDVYTAERKSHEDSFDVENKNSVNIFHSGLYDLTSLRDGGQLLIYSPGVPSIWFAPKLLSPAKAPLTLDKRLTPLLLLAIFVLMIFVFWRGAKEEGDARIWAALLALAVIVQFAWGVPQNVDGRLEYLDMVGVIAACMAVFFLPHIGRHLLVTEKKSPHFDSLLQFLAIPAIFPLIVLFIPIPEYLYIVRFAPLWGLYALVLFILTVPFVLSGRKGAVLYAFFCLVIGAGCLGALALRHDSEWYFLNYLGVLAAMIGIFLAPRQTEKNIFDERLSHEDIVSAFAENNTIMRDALYRVELKLRDPFDRIMREACFLDFDLKTEDFADSLALLKDKGLGDRIERSAKNAIDDVDARAQRLQEHTASLVLACRDLSGMLGHITDLAQKEPVHAQMHELFNVKTLITQACDNIRAEAQDRQIGLGWYIAPNIGLHYRGDKASLEVVLSLLLRDAVRATEKGMISVRVRRANSPNPGHIVFTISDSGKGRPPVQRSILTLVKAWELSTAYNGEVELRSSPHGLSFSFSMQCLAMDQHGEKPLSYASLDDIVLSRSESVYAEQSAGISGGNIVFAKEQEGDLPETETELQEPLFAGAQKDISILIISPLAIQRQNFVYYLNKYETWEALDVDSALAFYEKKPASLVLVHSALSANGCSAVIAGIRMLEDNLGIAHAPCVGLYQSAKDMEFLRLAGCNHTLPDNIGREDLCTAVAEIVGDRHLQPITEIEVSRAVVKRVDRNVQKAVQKRLNTERVYAGSVVDGAVSAAAFNEGGSKKADFAEQAKDMGKHGAAQEHTLDFHEEKGGVFSKFMKSFRPKPHNYILDQQTEVYDDAVGEPTPIPVRSSAEPKNEKAVSGYEAMQDDFVKKRVQPAEDEQGTVSESSHEFTDEPINEINRSTEQDLQVTAESAGKIAAEDLQTEISSAAEPLEVMSEEHGNRSEDSAAELFGGTDTASAELPAEAADREAAEAEGAVKGQTEENVTEAAREVPAAAAEFAEEKSGVTVSPVGESTVREPEVSVFSDQENFAEQDIEQDTEQTGGGGIAVQNDIRALEQEIPEIREEQESTVKISLNFLPTDTEFQSELDEDLPPQSVRNALGEIDDVEEITPQSVFVQSGLVTLEPQADETKESEADGQSENMAEPVQTSELKTNTDFRQQALDSVAAGTAESAAGRTADVDVRETGSVDDEADTEDSRGVPVLDLFGDTQNTAAREEQHTPRDLAEQHDEGHIIDLSSDMLVQPKEKAKKKPRRRKEEKAEKSGLDILLDYTADRHEDEEANKPRHDDKLIQLSFFPVDNEENSDKR